MTKIHWHYPNSLDEAVLLLRDPRIRAVGGGTDLIKRPLSTVGAFLSLWGLNLNAIDLRGDTWSFGSMCTYADVLKALESEHCGHVLYRSLLHAANTPCRNRITLGGSAAFAPRWSDLAGPLLALEADVHLAGDKEETVPYARYLQHSELRKKALITGISFRNFTHLAAHYREVRTHNDMPQFTVTVLLKMQNSDIREARIILVGSEARFLRLEKLESHLRGNRRAQLDADALAALVEVTFKSRPGFDPDYLAHKAKTESARCVISALESR